ARLVTPEIFTSLVRGNIASLEQTAPSTLDAEMIDQLGKSLKKLLPEVTAFFANGDDDLSLHGMSLRFGELSDGYRSLLALMGHLLRSSLRVTNWSDDPTRTHGILLIDEIDLHLHPAWQHHVVADFRRAYGSMQL